MTRMIWTPEQDAELKRIYALASYGRRVAALKKFAQAQWTTSRNCSNRAVVLGIARHWRPVTPTERQNIAMYAATKPPKVIAKILGRGERTICNELRLLRKPPIKDGYSVEALADLMGIQGETLAGLLKRWPIEKNKHQKLPSCDVQVWIWEHLDDLDVRPMSQGWLKRMLKEVAA